jgi:hypothetical protein
MTGWLRKFRLPRPTGQGLRTFALFMGAPIFGGLLAWQLYGLEPERVCSIPGAFVDNKDLASILNAFNACIGLYAKALDIKDHAVIGLLAILGLGYLMMMMRELRMQGEFTGPGGFGGKFKSEDAADKAADEVAGAAVDKAQEIKSS